MIVEAILEDPLEDMTCNADLIEYLTEAAKNSRTSKLWVENLIKPVQLMMLFVRAEREGDWLLHLYADATIFCSRPS